MADRYYGAKPESLGVLELEWDEYLHFMYLPVMIEGDRRIVVPNQLEFLREQIVSITLGEWNRRLDTGSSMWQYVYVTARRGYATPGNPLNRPGWHTDGFGGEDVNYVWTDRFPTLFAEQEFRGVSDDHVTSVHEFEEQLDVERIVRYPDRTLLRLDPFVVHAAPEIPAPGGERSFFKVSFSDERYNLKGNSHNHDLDYSWPMFSRDEVRNDPARAGKDTGGLT